MAINRPNGKRSLIDQANSKVVIFIAIAGFLVVFSLVASRALLSQRSYQSRVIAQKQVAVDQLEKNEKAVQQLAISYKEFTGASDNVIGGNPAGTGDRDGNNAKIVLDALPSKYDFPAFITSVEKLLKTNNFSPTSISGTDDELAQTDAATTEEPTEIPFSMDVPMGSYANVKDFLITLQRSIRPIHVNQVDISGGNGNLINVSVDATSYYQTEKGLTIGKKVVE